MINYDNNGLLWMDCETTGLTDNDKILEVAMHITDMRGNTLMGTIHTIIHHEPDFFNDLDDYVINMHTNNGLIHDCTHAGMSVQQAERKLTDYMKQANGFIDVLYPAGFSVSFDKTFINREMPAVLSNVQHRMVDLTCLNVMVSHLMPEIWNHIPDFHTDHRAYTCVRGEIDRYRSYLDVFMPALESLNMK